MGTAFAIRERTHHVPDTPVSKKELVKELRFYMNRLDVEARLEAYGAALRMVQEPSTAGAYYYLLALDPSEKRVTVYGYKVGELDEATKQYLDIERSIEPQKGAEAVLVSVESLDSLRRAYPNYFLDTTAFIEAVKQAID